MGYLIYALGAIALAIGVASLCLFLQWLLFPWSIQLSMPLIGAAIIAALYLWLEPLPKRE